MPTCPVEFDFAAAEDLSAELRRHATYLDGLAEGRSSARAVAVEDWSGRFRDDFDRDHASTQERLRSQADGLRATAGEIDDAAQRAREAKRTCERDHDHSAPPVGAGPR